MGKLSRTKGHSFERQIAVELREAGFPEARRQLEYHEKDANGVDIQGTGLLKIQAKRKRQYAAISALREVTCEAWEVPVLVTKADNEPAVAVLPWSDFLVMVARLRKIGAL